MKLYTATIRGRKYYFTGNLNEEVIKSCDCFCRKLESAKKDVHPNILFEYMLDHINSNYKCDISQVNIDHIFRINY